jgi:hypothetical protein
MLGYVVAGVIGLVLLAFLIAGLAKARPGSGSSSKAPGEQPVQTNAPAADAPTPDRSSTAKPKQVRTAREHTPPG